MKKCLAVILIFATLLSFCSCSIKKGNSSTTVPVYFLIKENKVKSGLLLKSEEINIEKPSSIIDETVSYLFSQPKSSDLVSPFPKGTHVLSYSLKNGELSLNLSREYSSLTGIKAILADYAITLTLCSLDDIYSVTIHVDGGRTSKSLTIDDIMDSSMDTNPYEKRILLYFPNSQENYLIPEHHNITIGQDSLLVRFVMEELISGPQQSELHSALPEGTELLSVTIDDSLCILDLSQEFYNNRPKNAASERMTIYSIVNSITALTGIDSVQILVNGKRIPYYLYIPLDKPLTKFEDVIDSNESYSNSHDITLFVVSPKDNQLIPISVSLAADEYQTLAFAALEKLITLKTGNAYINPFPEGTAVLSAVIYNNICRINLSKEFDNFQSEELEALAYKSIAASVIMLGEIYEIQVFIDGKKSSFECEDLISNIYSDPYLFSQ